MRILRSLGIFCVCLVMAVSGSMPAYAATQTKDGTIDVSGLVVGPPPAMAPTIDIPTQNTTFTQKLIDVKGGCIAGLVVRIFRNAIFAGSTLCQNTNTYSLQIDLTENRNDLVARQYDTLNQSSPDSNTVTVYFAPPSKQPHLPGDEPTPGQPSPQSPSGGGTPAAPSGPAETSQFQLIIDYDYSFRGITVNIPLHLPVHFSGGTPPYAVSVSWGDGSQSVISRETAEQFFVDHTYKQPGAYAVKLSVSDKNGNQAFLQFVLIVNGQNNPTDDVLFGLPIAFNSWFKIIFVAFVFALAGFGGGFLFSHYWRRKREKRETKDKNSKTKT